MNPIDESRTDFPETSYEPIRSRSEQPFKKLKRPLHAIKRSSAPERRRGMHRRRRKRMSW